MKTHYPNYIVYFCVTFFLFLQTHAQVYTWKNGSNTLNTPGVYGAYGIFNSAYTPNGREAATSWTDASGKFWLFGGITVILILLQIITPTYGRMIR